MKLPEPILEGVDRAGRADMMRSSGVNPAFLGGLIRRIPWVGKPLASVACRACNAIPNPLLKAACRAACR